MLGDLTKVVGDDIIFTGNHIEAYIPADFFDRGLAETVGGTLNVFGLFIIRIFDKSNKMLRQETFNLPTKISMYPSNLELKELTLLDGDEPERYQVASFFDGDVITHASIPQDATNAELFLSILTRGKIPKTVPYSHIPKLWQKNLEINGVKLGVTATILEVLVSEIYRNAAKPEETFAKLVGRKPDTSEYAYRAANIREVCARNSAFAAMTFEDIDQMINSSVNINRYNKKETQSPIEKIIKF